MRIALGVHVSTYEVTASLVETTLPQLGPVAGRTVMVADAPGGIGGAVATAIGFMRVQAMQNDLDVEGAAIVCENAVQRELVVAALADAEMEPLPVVDIFDERLSDAFTPDVGAALLVGHLDAVVATGPKSPEHRRGLWPVAAVGACVLAALGGVTAWAMTAAPNNGADTGMPSEVVYPTPAPRSPAHSATIPPAPTSTSSARPPTPELPGPDIVPGPDIGLGPVDVPRVVVPVPSGVAPQNNPITTTPPPPTTTTTTQPTTTQPTTTTKPTTPVTTPTPPETTTSTTTEADTSSGSKKADKSADKRPVGREPREP